MTQEILSGMAGISRANLSLIENGKAEPGLRTLVNIARAMNVTVSELLEGVR
jgi:transcriptional regulator with XRE-family HTH domain